MKLKMLIADSFWGSVSVNFEEAGIKGLANVEGDAFDDGVGECGGQCVRVEEVLIVEGCYTLKVRFQCVDGWD